MIGIMIASHGDLAESIVKSLELIMGKQMNYKTACLRIEDDIKDFREEVESKIHELDDGEGGMCFVDFMGGSPYNVIFQLMSKKNIQCLSGVNMPMVIEAFSNREQFDLYGLKEICLKTAIDSHIDLQKMFEMSVNASDNQNSIMNF